MFTDDVSNGIAWRERGAGPPVLFLHGLGGTRRSWGPQLRELSDAFRCVAWDLPGYGNSTPIIPLTFAAIAERVIDLIDALGEEQVDLVGLSFGGMHALHTVIAHPARVRRLVLADTSPAFGMDGTRREEWVRSRLASIEAGGTPADAAEAIIDGITAIRLTGEIRNETVGAFADIGADGFRAAVHCLPDNDVREQLVSIVHPTLIVVGELDAETPPSYSKVLRDGISNSELHVIAGAGHLTPAEAPDEFNRLVRTFLTADP